MKGLAAALFVLFCMINRTAAQQNWAAVPCFSIKSGDAIGRILYNEAHNELILCNYYSYEICGHTYKAFFAYDGSTFHDMDLGIEAQNPNPALGFSAKLNGCVEWNGNAIITGGFYSVGSDTLYSKNVAVWNGTSWTRFQHPLWNNTPTWNTGGGFSTLLKDNDKIWMFAGYDSTGSNFTSKPVLYDGLTFTPISSIPVNNQSAIIKAIKYKGKLVVTGNFYSSPDFEWFRLAQYDGANWSPVSTGVRGNLTGASDLLVYNDTLYIAGNFSTVDGNAGNYIMKWDGNQLTDAGFGVWCGYGRVSRLLEYRNRLYAFGSFTCAANQKAFGIAYFENGKWTVPSDSIDRYAIYDAVVYNDAIYVGGEFNSINGDTTIQKFAKLICPDFDAASGCISGTKEEPGKLDVKLFPNPVKDRFQIVSSVSIDVIILTNSLGQELLRINRSEQKKEFDISYLPAGIYFLTVKAGHGETIFKIVKV